MTEWKYIMLTSSQTAEVFPKSGNKHTHTHTHTHRHTDIHVNKYTCAYRHTLDKMKQHIVLIDILLNKALCHWQKQIVIVKYR